MNITLNTEISAAAAAGTEATSTYKASAEEVWSSGYKLDIADKVMDNEAYGHGLTADEIMQQAANTNVSVQKDFMIVMSNSVSGEDLQKMQEEGFNPTSTDVETYVNIVDKIKVSLAQAGVEVTGYTDDLDVDKIEEITGSRLTAETLAKDLSQMLSQADIPVTDENARELAEAVTEASQITGLSDEAVKYLVLNQKEPTIENLYKAQFVGTGVMQQPQGYYSEGIAGGSYYAKKADSISWDNLTNRIELVVSQAGLDTDEATKSEAVENAKWLVESGIELNAENLTRVSDLKSLSFPMELPDLEELCVTALENGKNPQSALMTGEASVAQQARELVEAVNNISDEAVHAVVEAEARLNIKNLSEAQKNIGTQQQPSGEASLLETQAKRQLEEIRLMMTEEANRRLLRAGISIDTTELSELVDTLKEAEDKMRAVLFEGADAGENGQRALIYEETLTKTGELADMPAAMVGRLAMSAQAYTLERFHAEGAQLQREAWQEADGYGSQDGDRQRQEAQAYETLMTAPRRDLGDSIRKAFQNVDDILEDMGLEKSEANRRAVRILGYNSMEITGENLTAVKEADSRISGVIDRMTPAATLQMIRDGRNPLEMTFDELDDYLNGQDKDIAGSSQKYSEFLQKLDRADAITESEREAYIGIYRLFHQIEQSDGAVIGSIVAAGAQMNFKNMLSAVRSASDKNMDVRIDDGFGALEALITKGEAIDGQIMSGFAQSGQDFADSQQQAKEQYYARLSGEINTELSQRTDVEKLKQADISETSTIEQFADSIKMLRMPEGAGQQEELQSERLKSFQESVREAVLTDEQVIESLIEYGQSVSVDNIRAAQLLMSERGSLFRRIAGNTDSDEEESAPEGGILEKAEQFTDALTDSESANDAYGEIIREAGKAVEEMIYQRDASLIDIRAAKSLYKGLALAGSLAGEENYEVPMNIKGEITSVNLKIYHNTSEPGKVSVTLETAELGKVAAEFDVTDESVSGMMVYENKSMRTELEQLEQTFASALSGSDSESQRQVSVSLVQSNALDLNRFGQSKRSNGADGKVSTAELYRTAKAFLTALKDI
ncbi:MAG: DUF6240 domain-containing protein [Lachnospiraceae bacterium]|nr:DUF6240 domain-containing protein [Lachnospiraceae bacterium]